MANEKYGIIYYKDTPNLGDDIQTYAASRFYKKIDYYIDRENISYFVPNKKEKVKVIMNGWYNHDKTNFLISPYIQPLFESIHFSKNDLILQPGYNFIDGYAKDVMSKYEIGCRDNETLNVLKRIGYKNVYFSSCITTTIEPIGEKKEEDYIVAVDLNPKIIKHLRKITNKKIIETTHWTFIKPNTSYREKIKKIEEYNYSSTEDRKKIVKNYSRLSFEQRMKKVEKQLKLYQNAKLVITDRIHVGLPCLGLNTNVLLIYYKKNEDRIKTFKDFIINCTEEEFLNKTEKDLLKVKNKTTYLSYKNKIIDKTNEFMNSKVEKQKLPEIEDYKNFIKREKYLKSMYIEKINIIVDENKKLKKELDITIENNNKYKKINESYKKKMDYYNKISNSRSWKYIKKIYEFRMKSKE